jgi:hypothetical protein
MYFFAFLDAELVAKGLLTNRTNDAIAVGQFTPGRFLLCHFWGYQINGISGHSFLRWYFYPHLCLLPY